MPLSQKLKKAIEGVTNSLFSRTYCDHCKGWISPYYRAGSKNSNQLQKEKKEHIRDVHPELIE